MTTTTTDMERPCIHDYRFIWLDIYKCQKCGRVIDVLEDADGY